MSASAAEFAKVEKQLKQHDSNVLLMARKAAFVRRSISQGKRSKHVMTIFFDEHRQELFNVSTVLIESQFYTHWQTIVRFDGDVSYSEFNARPSERAERGHQEVCDVLICRSSFDVQTLLI